MLQTYHWRVFVSAQRKKGEVTEVTEGGDPMPAPPFSSASLHLTLSLIFFHATDSPTQLPTHPTPSLFFLGFGGIDFPYMFVRPVLIIDQ